MEPSALFGEEVRDAWGNPDEVASVAFRELFCHGDVIALDFVGQVDYAKRVGVLAGTMKDGTPEEFIAAFSEKVLNE